jgi:WD40 repeat protein
MRSLILILLTFADVSLPARSLDAKRCGVVRTLAPRAGPIVAVSFSPDGRTLAAGGADGTVVLYETQTWGETGRFRPAGGLSQLAFAEGGKTLAVGGISGGVAMFEVASGRSLKTLQGESTVPVQSLVLSPGGRTLLVGTEPGEAAVWDVEAGRRLATLGGHSEPVSSAAFAPAGRRVATGGGGEIRLWTSGSWDAVRAIALRGGSVRALAFSPGGDRLASGDTENQVCLWNAETGKEERRFEGHLGAVQAVCFTADGRQILSASADMTLRIWDAARGTSIARLRHHWAPIAAIAVHPSGTVFATAGADRVVKVWGRVPDVAHSLRPRGLAGISVDPTPKGVRVIAVTAGGAAAQAGMQVGDVIRTIGGLSVLSYEQTADAIQCQYGGDEVDFVIDRGGVGQTLRVTLGSWPAFTDP